MSTRKTVGAYELVDHGIENPQYFQGCGTAFTDYDHVVTGIGDNPAEAIEDALESMAQMDYDTETMENRIKADEGWDEIPTTPDVHDDHADSDVDDDDSDGPYYHVSIRWSDAD